MASVKLENSEHPQELVPSLDEETEHKIRQALQAACAHETPTALFAKFDRDGSGELDIKELRTLLRKRLKVSPYVVSDQDIGRIVARLDLNESGTVNLSELAAFVESERSFQGMEHTIGRKHSRKAVRRPSHNKPQPCAKLHYDRAAMKRFQTRLAAAVVDLSFEEIVRRFDVDGDGTLEGKELERLVRSDLRISPEMLSDADLMLFRCAVDADGDGGVGATELAHFARRGMSAFVDISKLGKQWRPHAHTDPLTLGRILGALRAATGYGRSVASVLGSSYFENECDFVQAVRRILDEALLSSPDLYVLVALLTTPRHRRIDCRELAALIKRGGAAVFGDESATMSAKANREIAATQRRVERQIVERKIAKLEQQESKRAADERAQRQPPLAKPIRPRPSEQFFGWLDDDPGSLAPLLRSQLCALRTHEDMGQALATGVTLARMARQLAAHPYRPTNRTGDVRAQEILCAADALLRSEQLVRADLGADHIVCTSALLDASDLLLRADDLLSTGNFSLVAPVSREDVLERGKRCLLAVKGKLMGRGTDALTPTEQSAVAKAHVLLGRILARQGKHHAAVDTLTKALRLYHRQNNLGTRISDLAQENLAAAHYAFACCFLEDVRRYDQNPPEDQDKEETQRHRQKSVDSACKHLNKAATLYADSPNYVAYLETNRLLACCRLK